MDILKKLGEDAKFEREIYKVFQQAQIKEAPKEERAWHIDAYFWNLGLQLEDVNIEATEKNASHMKIQIKR